jgi:hypothetical protein
MLHAVVVLSLLLSNIPQEERAPSFPNLTPPPSATLLVPRDTSPGFSRSLFARADASQPRTYGKFLIVRKGGESIEGREGLLDSNRLTGTSVTGEPVDVPVDDIQTLYTSQGSPILEGALWGGALGLALTVGPLIPIAIWDTSILSHPLFPKLFAIIAAPILLLFVASEALLWSANDGWRVEPIFAPGKLYVLRFSFRV